MRPAAWFLIAGVAVSCGVTMPAVVAPVGDPTRFERCADAEGQKAYDAALVQVQAGKDREAVPLLRTVVERCPEHVPAHRYYQEAAQHTGGTAAAAMADYYRALPERTDSPVPTYVKAALLKTDFERSLALTRLLERHPDFPWGHLSLARVQRKIGKLKEAADGYQRTLDLHPGLIEAYVEQAETLVELGQFAAAALAYDNYLRARPNDRATMRAYAQVLLYRLGNHEAARPWIERMLAMDPADVAARMDLAAVEWRAGRLELALAGYLGVLERAEASGQMQARAVLNIANLHYDAFGDGEPARRAHWPKARKAYLLYLKLIRPEDGHDQFERMLAVPFRLKEIERLLGPDDGAPVTIADLR